MPSPGVNGSAAASQKMVVEVGYIGRIIKHEYELIDIDAVPWMTTLNGQSFANAYANLYQEVASGGNITVQPFFEAALGGPTSAYCAKFSSCTAAVASNQASNIKTTQVYSLWSVLNAAPGWTLGRTLLSSPAVAGGNVGQQITELELSTRRPILGLDTSDGGAGIIRGFPTWNLDATVSKDVRGASAPR